MANTYRISATLTGLLLRAAGRFKASMESSALVGPGSPAVRFAKIQWTVIFWRYLTLAEVLVMGAACPSCYFPVENALIILGLGILHTLVFSFLRVRTALTATRPFYIADFAVCMALMILARDGTLIMVISFYATTALFVRPMVRIGQAMALSGLAGACFFVAMTLAPPADYSTASIANFSLIFFFWGLGWVFVCRLIERSAALEIDMHIEEQRRRFRRRLHDDLGNTLCGLHFRIQSLFRLDQHDMGGALARLEEGYERAAKVLDRILRGIEDVSECDSVDELIRMVKRDFDIRVQLTGNTADVCLSPLIRQEIFSLMREAIANSVKHAGIDEVTIDVSRRRKRLEITVSDRGAGFEPRPSAKHHATRAGHAALDGTGAPDDCSPVPDREGGFGLINMRERAEAVGATLSVGSQPGVGTTVFLSLKENEMRKDPAGRIADRLIESDTYLLILRLKLMVLALAFIQMILGGSAVWSNPAALLVTFLVSAEAIAWYLFRDRLSALLNRHPWWLIMDILFFCLLYFISWRAGIPVVVAEATSMAISISAMFLGASRNLALAMVLGAGMIFASLLAPSEASMSLMRHKELFIDVMDNLILAVIAGMIFKFICSINNLRTGVVDIALERHRASLSAATHKALSQLVESLQDDIHERQAAGMERSTDEIDSSFITSLQSRSNLLKKSLRRIMSTIDRPVSEMPAVDLTEKSPGVQ